MSLPDAPQERTSIESPTFRVSVTRVEVSLLVHDSAGTPVTGLQASDFEILEDGVPQTMRSFIPSTHTPSRLTLPEPALPPATGASPVPTIPPPASNYFASESRVFALILDDLHVDVRRTEVARAAARRLVSQLEPSDLLLVVTTSSTDSTGFFTRDRTYATRMIDTFTGRRLLDKTMQGKRFRGTTLRTSVWTTTSGCVTGCGMSRSPCVRSRDGGRRSCW